MVILGIDPGYAIVGYGAICISKSRFYPIGYGAILTDASQDFPARLNIIYDKMLKILNACHPNAVAVEKLYFQNNQKTAIQVAEARGVILLAAKREGIPIYEYTPLQVKTAVTGYGKAKKNQVMEMTKKLLNLEEVPKPDDTADALAIAICHANMAGSNLRLKLVNRNLGYKF